MTITLSDAIGNVETRAVLSALLKKPESESRPPVLISGDYRTGKTTLAKAYARAYGCNTRELCGTCPGCSMPEKSHLTVRIFHGSTMSIIDARALESMGALLLHQKVMGSVLIDDAHLLSAPVAVALARAIDESSSRIAFALTATGPVHPALDSRVLPLKTRNLTRSEALTYLDSIGYSGDSEKIYRASGGSVGRLVGMVAVAALSGSTACIPDPVEAALLTLRALYQTNMGGGMAALMEYVSNGGTYDELIDALRTATLDILRSRVGAIELPDSLKEFSGLTEQSCIIILKVLRDSHGMESIADTLDKAHTTFALMLDALSPEHFAPVDVADSQSEDWDGDLQKLVTSLPNVEDDGA